MSHTKEDPLPWPPFQGFPALMEGLRESSLPWGALSRAGRQSGQGGRQGRAGQSRAAQGRALGNWSSRPLGQAQEARAGSSVLMGGV